MLEFLAIAFCGLLNRMSGTTGWMGKDDEWTDMGLPGRALWYTAPVLMIVALAFHPLSTAFWVGAGYLIWRSPAWGYLQLLGRPLPGKRPETIEDWFLTWAGGHVHLAHFMRQLLIAPFMIALLGAWLGSIGTIIVAAAITMIYETAWNANPKNPIWIAETATGLYLGALMVVSA
jgi:hypothetical protein